LAISKTKKQHPWVTLTILELTLALMLIPGLWIIVPVLSNYMPFTLAGLTWGAVFLYTGKKNADWACPRCGKPFHRNVRRSRFGLITPIRLRCPNCGIRRGEKISN